MPRSFVAGIVLALIVALPAHALCQKMSAPMVGAIGKMDWNNAFPIHILGFPIGPNGNPPTMYQPPICLCEYRIYPITLPGIGMSYWAPAYLADTSNESGCMITMNMELLDSYSSLNSGEGPFLGKRRQIHWFEFPLMTILELFADLGCSASNQGFDLAYITEIDPLWQDDLWAALFNPESALFDSPVARLICVADAIVVQFLWPLDPLFWCLGASHLYPTSGTDNTNKADEMTNLKALGRFLARQHRIGALWGTIGPLAQCHATYMPILPKSQYRIDPVFPLAENGGPPIYLGKHYFFWKGFPPALGSFPTHESGAFMIWRGTQCCIRL